MVNGISHCMNYLNIFTLHKNTQLKYSKIINSRLKNSSSIFYNGDKKDDETRRGTYILYIYSKFIPYVSGHDSWDQVKLEGQNPNKVEGKTKKTLRQRKQE